MFLKHEFGLFVYFCRLSKAPTQDRPSKNTRANKQKSVHIANDTADNEPPLQRNEVNEMIERGIANMIP